MSAKSHILTLSEPLLEWNQVRAACGATVKHGSPVLEVMFDIKPGQKVAVLRILFGRSCGKCLKAVEKSGWLTYSYGIVESSEAEELRREMEA